MKAMYQKPSAELIRFENEDIITTSGLMDVYEDCGKTSILASNPDCSWGHFKQDNGL